MDIPQLKLLAARVRALVQQADHTIGHNQSLDIAASLAGLRNWPEVQAFPQRVAAARVDDPAVGRLAFRLKRQFGLELSREKLLATLDPQANANLPEIWPTGPAAGIYLTTSQAAINALLERFEDASDGALVYAERAGSHWDGSIDLGEGGLWSGGLQRVPRGTLIVVGPIDLEQSSWDDSGGRLEMACYKAHLDGHRVAVLVNTPSPERLCEDVHLLVRSQPDTGGIEEALRGLVSEDGRLIERRPFLQRTRHAALTAARQHTPRVDAIPSPARELLRTALAAHRSGVIVVGAGDISEHSAIALVEASLLLTDQCGPAARIMPRTRSTPSKYWNVPEAVRELPFLPSIQSAYDQGFRRMVVYGNYTDADVYLQYPDVLFIASGWGCHVSEAFTIAARLRVSPELALLDHVLAILAVVPLSQQLSDLTLSDLYLKPQRLPPPDASYEKVMEFVEAHRAVRWEDQFAQLYRRFGETRLVEALRDNRDVPRTIDRLLAQLRRDAVEDARGAERSLSAAELVTKKVSLLAANVANSRESATSADGQIHANDAP